MPETFDDLSNQLTVARNEIKNLRQQLVALKNSHKKDVDDILSRLQGANITTGTKDETSNACKCEFHEWCSIGHIKSWFPGKRGVPRQAGICPQAEGVITLSPTALNNPSYSLCGLDEYSHIWILFHFHKTEGTHVRTKVAPPRLGGERVGVFATRAPHRPCPIGLSLVKLNRIDGNKIYFTGVDMMDGTPVIDIKPYIPQYDVPQNSMPSTFHASERLVEGQSGSSPVKTVPASTDIPDIENEVHDQMIDDTLSYNGEMEEERSATEGGDHGCEREAPDGEEGAGAVQVPSWVGNSSTQLLNVVYTDRALSDIGEHATLQSTLTRLLEQDPRSTYLRRKLGSQFYTFRIESMHVTVKFEDASGIVTVMFVQPAASVGNE